MRSDILEYVIEPVGVGFSWRKLFNGSIVQDSQGSLITSTDSSKCIQEAHDIMLIITLFLQSENGSQP
jgi:hypothetical protein